MARYASDRKRREFAARRAAFTRLSECRITDGHHYLHFDRAAEVAAALNEFFGSHQL